MDAEQLTDDEWGRIHTRKALKGFTRLDARYFVPFFTKKFTRQVSIVLLEKVEKPAQKNLPVVWLLSGQVSRLLMHCSKLVSVFSDIENMVR